MEKTHASHIGIEGCIRQARDTLYWPLMTTEIKEYISKCDVCMTHRTGQGKEPMLQHEFVTWPWARVAADLCEFDNRVLLVVSDYYSNFIEVARLSNLTSHAVIKELKAIFARYGVPDTLVMVRSSPLLNLQFSRRHGCSNTRHRRQPILSLMERQRKWCRPSKPCLESARHPEHQSFKHY